MSTNIYVGNLPYSATAEELRDLFSAHGTVESVNLITDRETSYGSELAYFTGGVRQT